MYYEIIRSSYLKFVYMPILLEFNPLTPVPALTSCDEPWPLFLIWCHHLWQNGHYLGLTSAGGKDLSNDPQSEWSAQWSLKYAPKWWKSWLKNSEQNFPRWHMATPWYKLPVSMMLSQNYWTGSKPSRRGQSLQQKEKKRGKREGHFLLQKCACLSKNVVKTLC